jgi:hypothetical protein
MSSSCLMIQWILVKTPRSLRLFILTAIIKLCFVEVEEGKIMFC